MATALAADPSFRLFLRLWGIAALAHVVASYALADLPEAVAVAHVGVAAAAVLLTLRPQKRWLLVLSVLIIASAFFEMPVMGNHWMVATFVSVGALLTLGDPQRVAPMARVILVVFYSFAAFAKLNAGFFSPEVSCGLFYANQMLAGFGMPEIAPSAPWAWGPILGTALIELAVVPLLLIRRTRYLGVVLASVFHILISYDLGQHFYDFTSILLALFSLFLPMATAERIEAAIGTIRPGLRRVLSVAYPLLAALMVGAAVTPLRPATGFLIFDLPFVIWIPFTLFWIAAVIGFRAPTKVVGLRLAPAAAALAIVVVLNGLAPYFEIKTAQSFNMYANLVTAQGRSNHFLVRRTFPLRDGFDGPVEILDSQDPDLRLYQDREYLIAYPEFVRYMADHPGTQVTFARDGVTQTSVTEAPKWWWRFFPLRSLDANNPPRCQDVWLPAL